MRALRCNEYGPPESLSVEDIAAPTPGAGEVTVDVMAAAVNWADNLIINNKYQRSAEPPFTVGNDFAGVVAEVGEGVTDWSPGDRVRGAALTGAFAERVCVKPASLRSLPANVDWQTGAAISIAYETAIHSLLSAARVKEGDDVVVLGASGGVGSACVELAVLLGARVIACASSQERLAIARELGAVETINYDTEDLKNRIKALTDGGADVVLDPVGGAYAEQALRATKFRGRYIVLGFAAGEIPRVPLNLFLLKGVEMTGLDVVAFPRQAPAEWARNNTRLERLLADGKLRPHVSRCYPLERAAEAIRDVAERRTTGKVIIDVDIA
jgi:NADPH2:quinone reductase